MTAVDEAMAEIRKALEDMADAHEGLYDYSRLNISEETRGEVNASIQIYDRRRDHLAFCFNALRDLIADGYPELPVRGVSPSALQDLQTNAQTVAAALTRFSSNAAVDMGLQPAEPEPKV